MKTCKPAIIYIILGVAFLTAVVSSNAQESSLNNTVTKNITLVAHKGGGGGGGGGGGHVSGGNKGSSSKGGSSKGGTVGGDGSENDADSSLLGLASPLVLASVMLIVMSMFGM